MKFKKESKQTKCDFFRQGEYQGLIVLKKPLNFEDKSSYNLVVEARDGGEITVLTAVEDVIVEVEDVQDQDPVFLNGPYSISVPEGVAPSSRILEVQVRDGDTGRPRPVELSLAGDGLGYFTLVQTSLTADGILTAALTTTDNVIDRENPNILKEGGLYQFEVCK